MGLILPLTILGIAIAFLILFLGRTYLVPQRAGAIARLLSAGRSKVALAAAKRLVAKDRNNTDARYLLGKAYVAEGEPRLGLIELERVNRTGAFSAVVPETEFRQGIAALYRQFDKAEEALKEYLLLMERHPRVAEYAYFAGQLFADRGDGDRAAGFFRKTLEVDPEHMAANAAIAQYLYRGGKEHEASGNFQMVLAKDPDHAQSNYYLGRIRKSSRDYQGALGHFQRAQRDPAYRVDPRRQAGLPRRCRQAEQVRRR